MKHTNFKWAWGNYEPQHDAFMTRTRAAKLLRMWRASPEYRISSMRYNGKRFYIVRRLLQEETICAASVVIEPCTEPSNEFA